MGSASSRGRHPDQAWLVRLRRGDRSVIVAIGLRRNHADRLAEQINQLLADPAQSSHRSLRPEPFTPLLGRHPGQGAAPTDDFSIGEVSVPVRRSHVEERGTVMEWTLEVVVVPVADVERAKAFYADRVGFIVDFDMETPDRVVQLTPSGSGCSIQIGDRLTQLAPGSMEGLQLVVADLPRAHHELTSRGVDVGAIQVFAAAGPRAWEPGEDLDNVGFCYFADPDGNRWAVQQISTRTA